MVGADSVCAECEIPFVPSDAAVYFARSQGGNFMKKASAKADAFFWQADTKKMNLLKY